MFKAITFCVTPVFRDNRKVVINSDWIKNNGNLIVNSDWTI